VVPLATATPRLLCVTAINGIAKAVTPLRASRRARGERNRPSRGWDSLTPTALLVLRPHTAAGLTKRQIGQRMFISPGTVKDHSRTPSSSWAPSRSHLAAED